MSTALRVGALRVRVVFAALLVLLAAFSGVFALAGAGFLAGAFFAAAFLAGAFFVAAFLAGAFLVVVDLAATFLAGALRVRLAAGFDVAVFSVDVFSSVTLPSGAALRVGALRRDVEVDEDGFALGVLAGAFFAGALVSLALPLTSAALRLGAALRVVERDDVFLTLSFDGSSLLAASSLLADLSSALDVSASEGFLRVGALRRVPFLAVGFLVPVSALLSEVSEVSGSVVAVATAVSSDVLMSALSEFSLRRRRPPRRPRRRRPF